MLKIRSTTQLAAAVLACGSLALALGARAEAGSYSTEMKSTSVACERATLSAWFEAQRQLTDGGATSVQESATPRACATTYGANAVDEAAPARKRVAAAKAPEGQPRSNFEGLLGGQ